jgi:hypothetical protein
LGCWAALAKLRTPATSNIAEPILIAVKTDVLFIEILVSFRFLFTAERLMRVADSKLHANPLLIFTPDGSKSCVANSLFQRALRGD